MFYVVYIDVLFLVNFFMDFITLTLAGRLLRKKSGIVRRLLSAALGAACFCLIMVLPFYRNKGLIEPCMAEPCMALVSLLMVAAAFPLNGFKDMIKSLMVFYGSNFFLGGAVTGIYNYTKLGYYLRIAAKGDVHAQITLGALAGMVIAACILWKLIMKWQREKCQKDAVTYLVRLKMGNRETREPAFLDTGNHLREPISGKPVILIDMDLAGELLDDEVREAIYIFYETGQLNRTGIRLIPYHSVGKNNGMLAGVFLDCLQIENEGNNIEVAKPCIAVCREPIFAEKAYRILLNPELMAI